MASDCSSLLQNLKVKKEENVAEKFPYKILNDLAKKMKVAEDKIASMLAENESHRCEQTKSDNVCNQVVKEEPQDASEDAKDNTIRSLKQRISELELTHENNRYHLAISNCTFCASDEPDSPDASIYHEVSIKASTPLPTLDPGPASLSSTIPDLMSITWDRRQADTVQKSKDQSFINRMVKALTKLETKYKTPEHKRKKRLFTRKQRICPIVPKEFASIFHVLAAPEPETVAVPEPFPHVRWNEVRFKPALPNPELCPVYSCSKDPEFYQEKREYRNGSVIPTVTEPEFLRKDRPPFGTLRGYKTSLGVVAVPTTPVGGYVYCPDARKWVIFAEARSSASMGRGTRRGGATSHARRSGG